MQTPLGPTRSLGGEPPEVAAKASEPSSATEPETEEAVAADLTARQEQVVALVEQQGYATIEVLAETFGVSAQTVRRDIIRLDSLGLLQRFHGGVGSARQSLRLGYEKKRDLQVEAKLRIATRAAAVIEEGSALFLDVGTTLEATARLLAARPGFTVFTNSTNVAALFGAQHHRVHVLGGELAGADGSLVGVETVEALRSFRMDYALIGCSAVEEVGVVMDNDLRKVAVKQAAMRSARTSLLLADRSKFGRSARVRIADLDDFDQVVCG